MINRRSSSELLKKLIKEAVMSSFYLTMQPVSANMGLLTDAEWSGWKIFTLDMFSTVAMEPSWLCRPFSLFSFTPPRYHVEECKTDPRHRVLRVTHWFILAECSWGLAGNYVNVWPEVETERCLHLTDVKWLQLGHSSSRTQPLFFVCCSLWSVAILPFFTWRFCVSEWEGLHTESRENRGRWRSSNAQQAIKRRIRKRADSPIPQWGSDG